MARLPPAPSSWVSMRRHRRREAKSIAPRWQCPGCHPPESGGGCGCWTRGRSGGRA
ncbi:hypothetical protein FOYG_17629 [Fusarium oxysporum NRRL 32931]|uniref:Uncharacterized protein n=1 Tax=Fusarium oxysporum NRRL 32931 TaxID=660029 RepID=W9HDW6_FUSOX|nr:hypothetical protein FOYG_17629 [Fusarium oxysporum NRRL 32931]